jgi:CRISPR/Cas system CMR-associated protein Cmr5 small subunit
MSRLGPVRVDQHMAAAAEKMLGGRVTAEIRARCRQLPIILRTTGLAATYALLVGRTDDSEVGMAHARVAEGIRRYLVENSGLGRSARNNEEMLAEMAAMGAADYARATMQTEMLVSWLARLADTKHRLETARAADRDPAR